MTDERRQLGKEGEERARAYLEQKGYRLIETNYRTPLGEIDLVMEDGKTLVFVEVKAGESDRDFSPLDHFDSRKQRKLLTLGRAYLARFGRSRDGRFDLLLVTREGVKFRIDHLEDVIQDPGP
ncbi:MAG: YraN family protein [Pseudomonadota bacterium]